MPASNPGNRLAMEDALGPARLRALREQCRVLGVRLDRWHLVAAIARPWETEAALRLAEQLHDGGETWEAAIMASAIRLGLNPDTVDRRSRRWPRDAYDKAA